MNEIRVLGARVRSLREDRDLTQGQLAYKTDTTSAQISRIENNERPGVQAVTVAAIAQVLGTTVEYLCGMTNDPGPLPPPEFEDDLSPEHALLLQKLSRGLATLSPEARERLTRKVLSDLEFAEAMDAMARDPERAETPREE